MAIVWLIFCGTAFRGGGAGDMKQHGGEVIRTDKANNAPPLAELIDLYSENKRAALEYEGKARMYLAEILYALAGNADRPETVLHVIQRLRML